MKQTASLSSVESSVSDSSAMDFHSATGKLDYTLTNDFLFKSLLQKNRKVLKALVASLMHLKIDEIISIEITNPIELGSSVTDKTFNLDIRLILNENTVVNLEMQVLNKGFWPERSIGYLARSFDNLKRGDDYGSTKSVIHIGFLDFDLPGIPPEFYGTYKLLNVKNHSKYSDKFALSVVNLKHIDMATAEDKKYHIDKWAALFKADTWEEIKMIAGTDEYLNEASSELFKRLADLAVQEECEAREEYYRERQYMTDLRHEVEEVKKELARSKEDLAKNKKDLAKNKKDLARNKADLARNKADLARNKANLARKDKAIAKQNETITKKDKAISEKNRAITEKISAIAEKDKTIAQKSAAIAEKDKTINTLNNENVKLRKLLEQNNISISF